MFGLRIHQRNGFLDFRVGHQSLGPPIDLQRVASAVMAFARSSNRLAQAALITVAGNKAISVKDLPVCLSFRPSYVLQ